MTRALAILVLLAVPAQADPFDLTGRPPHMWAAPFAGPESQYLAPRVRHHKPSAIIITMTISAPGMPDITESVEMKPGPAIPHPTLHDCEVAAGWLKILDALMEPGIKTETKCEQR